MHELPNPSPWLQRWAQLLPAGGHVLDVACGRGRHLRWLAGRGHRVTGIDRDAAALAVSADLVASAGATLIEADVESGPWPCVGQTFDVVVVANYLWRPLWPTLLAALAPGGVLVYETFAAGNETVGKPSRPDFLLQPGELLARCAGLRIVAFEDGFLDAPARFLQRVVAVRPASHDDAPPRYPLTRPAAA
jgi:SAM-dependent methyltransferase